ncbi:MAG: SUMF1/EgtB/PvdO family nonheme iron enzyme [Chitinispirillaceae bacterium]
MRTLMIACMVPVVLLFVGCSKSNPNGPGTNAPAGMAHISSGTFQMGSTADTNSQPVHSVTVSAFYMDTTEVTQNDYQSLMGVNPAFFTGNLLRPIEYVSWFDAILYCNKRSRRDGFDTVYSYDTAYFNGSWYSDIKGLVIDFNKNGYRLPTEAEWEYACRAGTTTDYYWGRNYPPTTPDDTSAIDSNAVWHTSAPLSVGTKLPNAWGLYDMAGNINEWCNDWYDSTYYQSSPLTDPTGPASGTHQVFRGGPFYSNTNLLRSAIRSPFITFYPSGTRTNDIGFRCVRR